MIIQDAILLFDNGDYREAFKIFTTIYNESKDLQERRNIMSMLQEAYYEPNVAEMQENYEKNVIALSDYPYIWDKDFVNFSDLSFLLFPTSDETYFLYDKKIDRFMGEYDGRSSNKMRYFFQDLDQPIKLEDEDNLYNLTFLFDNVRSSEDVAMDNHIYLIYHSWQHLQMLMQVGDMTPILKHEKFVFLVGKTNHGLYPIDFKSRFGIDYSIMQPQKLRLDELDRIVVFSSTNEHCGNAMIDSLLDWHPNLLTIKEFGLSAFSSFYENCLKGKSCIEFIDKLKENSNELKYRPFLTFFCKIYRDSEANLPTSQKFIQYLFDILKDIPIPSKKQWFCALFYANSLALDKPLNSRIVPVIFHAPHVVWSCNWNAEYGEIQKVYKSFKYVSAFSVLRRVESMIGGSIKYEINCQKLYNTKPRDCFPFLFFQTEELRNVDWRRIYHNEHSFFSYENVVIIRYEDVKTNPKATLYSLCEHFNIPWSDSLLQCTHNGRRTIYNDAGTVISDFDLKPLAADYYGKYLNHFDRFRIELLYSRFYQYWGYKPKLYDGINYSDHEIEKMFELPFQFEGSSHLWSSEYRKQRKDNLLHLKKLLNYLHSTNKQVESKEMIPYKLLMPKLEYCIHPIYE